MHDQRRVLPDNGARARVRSSLRQPAMAVVAVVVFVDAAPLARTPAASSWRAGWLVASLAAYAAVLMAGRRGDLGGRAVWAGVAATLVVAVILAPYGSKDMWTYAAYGRAVATYHQSPYLHVPAEHPDDRITKEMAPEWRHTRAAYGPVFVAIVTTGMAVAGDSPALARAYFQGLAALALLAALVLLARAGRGRRVAQGPPGSPVGGSGQRWQRASRLPVLRRPRRRGRSSWRFVGPLVASLV